MKIAPEPLYPADETPRLLMVAWNGRCTNRAPLAVGPDQYPLYPEDPLLAIHQQLNPYIAETAQQIEWRVFPEKLDSGKKLMVDQPDQRGQVILATTARIVWMYKAPQLDPKTGKWIHGTDHMGGLKVLLAALLRGGYALDLGAVRELLAMVTGPMMEDIFQHLPALGLVMAVHHAMVGRTLSEADEHYLSRFLRVLLPHAAMDTDPVRGAAIARKAGSNPVLPEMGDCHGAIKKLQSLLNSEAVLSELARVVLQSTAHQSFYLSAGERFALLVDLLEMYPAKQPISPELRHRLETIKSQMGQTRLQKADAKNLERLKKLLDPVAAQQNVEAGEAWSDALLADLKKASGDMAGRWWQLLLHCETAESAKPSGKWLKTAAGLVAEIGAEEFKQRVLEWFPLVAKPRTIHRDAQHPESEPDPNLLITPKNATILRGLAWCCAGVKDTEISRALSDLAEIAFKKVRWLGPRCPRVGNACLYSLSSTVSEEAAAALTKLDQVVKQPTAKKRIGKSLDVAAENTGQTRADLEEKSVPTYDLDAGGKIVRVFGRHTATLQIVDSREVEVAWTDEKGKALKSVPVEVKKEHAADLKKFQKLTKEIAEMLGAQRIRLERLLMTTREWDLAAWRARYLDQPLLSGLARRLIWHFKLGERTALGAWLDGKLVDVEGKPLDWLGPETRVRLWHPIGFPVETVAAWREWLTTREVCQPFKQAHREVYIITDAELTTATYSNRFAAHILGQHQFAALCRQRGWKYAFMGGFDSFTVPTLELPQWNLKAEFWVDGTGQLADSGVCLYLATDQVRFARDGQTLALSDVPAVVFSEVMRDVDLFVGVGSIGADPQWQDTGEVAGAGAYWQSFSFGELNNTAKTRREVLARLLPKLKIAARCTLQERFLVVRGELRTYNIHLGSGNIRMEPNNQYLCIVPARGETAKPGDEIFLPFEGDRTLAVILSKAFMLAEDTKIKDASILSQIRTKT